MGSASRPGSSLPTPNLEILAGTGMGIVAAALTVGAMATKGPLPVLLAAVAIPVIAAVILRPRYGMILLIFCMSFVEEFRGGIGEQAAGGDEYLRSERTPFYSATIGIPALYLPDILIGGVLLLYVIRTIVWRMPMRLRLDRSAWVCWSWVFRSCSPCLFPLGAMSRSGRLSWI